MATRFDDYADQTVDAALTGHTKRVSSATSSTATVRTAAGLPGEKRVELASGGSQTSVWVPDEFANTTPADQQVFVLYRTPVPPDATVTYAAAFVRSAADGLNRYSAEFFHVAGGARHFRLVRSGAAFATVVIESFAWADDTVYAVLLEATGTTIRAKRWIPADLNDPKADEPASWTLSGTNADLASGEPGIGMREQSTVVSSVIAAGYGTAGDPAPMKAAAATFDPADLVAVNTTGTTADLSWTASPTAGVADYQVFHRTPQTGAAFNPETDTPAASGITGTTHQVTGLDPATSYDVQVFGRVPG